MGADGDRPNLLSVAGDCFAGLAPNEKQLLALGTDGEVLPDVRCEQSVHFSAKPSACRNG